jgi:hypothetical protein
MNCVRCCANRLSRLLPSASIPLTSERSITTARPRKVEEAVFQDCPKSVAPAPSNAPISLNLNASGPSWR